MKDQSGGHSPHNVIGGRRGSTVTLIENVYYVLGTLHILSYFKEGYGIRELYSHTNCPLKSLQGYLRSSSQMIKP